GSAFGCIILGIDGSPIHRPYTNWSNYLHHAFYPSYLWGINWQVEAATVDQMVELSPPALLFVVFYGHQLAGQRRTSGPNGRTITTSPFIGRILCASTGGSKKNQ